MKNPSIFLGLGLAVALTPLFSQKGLDEPPGKLEIAKHPMVLEPPSGPRSQKLDVGKMHQQALDLAHLAESLPDDIDRASHGKLAKDLADRLKQIEKLSKQLRGELAF